MTPTEKVLSAFTLTILVVAIILVIIAVPKMIEGIREQDQEDIHRNNLCIKAGYQSYVNSRIYYHEYKLRINNTSSYILYIYCNNASIENGILHEDTRLIPYTKQDEKP